MELRATGGGRQAGAGQGMKNRCPAGRALLGCDWPVDAAACRILNFHSFIFKVSYVYFESY